MRGKPNSELALLLACAAVDGTTGHRVAGEFDWDQLLALAQHHRLTTALHAALSADRLPQAPDGFRRAVAAAYHTNAQQALRNAGALLQIVRELEREEVPVLTLKGPAVAVAGYGGLAQRHAGDLDLLVPKAHVPACLPLLRELGYRPLQEISNDRVLEALFRSWHHLNFVREDGLVAIELHWRLSAPRHPIAIAPDEPWQQPTRVPLGEGMVATLATDMQLLYLCEHGSRHAWKRFFWLQDVALHLQGTGAGLDTLDRVLRGPAGRRVLFGLGLARELLGAPLSPAVAAKVDEAQRRAPKLYLAWPSLEGGSAFSLGRHRYQLSMMTRPRDRVRYLLAILERPEFTTLPETRRSSPLDRLLKRLRRLR